MAVLTVPWLRAGPPALASLSTGVGTMPLARLGNTAGRGVSARQPGVSLPPGGHGPSDPGRDTARQGRAVFSRDGTPGSQSVAEKFEVTWETVMVSSHGAVVVKCDGRGSGFQGTKLLHEVRRRLGVLEERDQTEAVR